MAEPISGINGIKKADTPAVNKIKFTGGEFNNFINRLRSGEPIIGRAMTGMDPTQSTQQSFVN